MVHCAVQGNSLTLHVQLFITRLGSEDEEPNANAKSGDQDDDKGPGPEAHGTFTLVASLGCAVSALLILFALVLDIALPLVLNVGFGLFGRTARLFEAVPASIELI